MANENIKAEQARLNSIVNAMAVKASLNSEMRNRLANINNCEDGDPAKLLSYAEGIVESVKNMDPQIPELKGFTYAKALIDNLTEVIAKNTDEKGKLTVDSSEILKWLEPLVMLNAKMIFMLSLKA